MSDNTELPIGWEWKELGNICNLFCDGNWIESKDQSNNGIRLIQVGNIGKGIFIEKNESKRFISEKTFIRLNCTEVLSGDILISRLPDPVGRACIVPPLLERMITAVDCTIARVNTNLCDKQFILYCLSSDDYFTQVNTLLAGATRKRISRTNLESIEIPLPPIIEQQHIANIIESKLKSVEKMIKINIEQKIILEKLLNSYMEKLFFSNDLFEKVKLEDICLIERGGSPRPIEHYLTKDKDGINWIKIGDAKINSKYIDSTAEKIIEEGVKRSRSVKVGDLILSNSMSFGRPYILNIDGCIHDGWVVFSNFSNNINKDYLYYILSSSIVKKQFDNEARGAIVKNLNIDIVKEVIIPLPKMTEQINIVKELDRKYTNIENVKNLLKEQSSYINALSSSILRKAFNGEY